MPLGVGYSLSLHPWVILSRYTRELFPPVLTVGYSRLFSPWVFLPCTPVGIPPLYTRGLFPSVHNVVIPVCA